MLFKETLSYKDPTAVVSPNALIGDNVYIGPFCYVGDRVVIGDNTRLTAYCSIGTPPEHKDYMNTQFGVVIGSNCVIREFTTVNSGTVRDTLVGSGVWMLRGSHVGHDAEIHDKTNLSCNVLVGGHTIVMEGANLGLGAIVHQNLVIGPYSMVGMGAIVTKSTNVEPFKVYTGNPAKYLKDNSVGVSRANLSDEDKLRLISEWENKCRKG